jgi:hypothetical protein
VCFHAAFALAAYLLLRMQVALSTHQNQSEKVGVFVAKWVDDATHGFILFSTNLTYVLLVSFVAVAVGSSRRLFPALLLFTAGFTLVAALFTAMVEASPHLYRRLCSSRGSSCESGGGTVAAVRKQDATQRTVEVVNDWFINNWQMLIGFAGWTTLTSVLGTTYADVYETVWAWWVLWTVAVAICVSCALLVARSSTTQAGSHPHPHPHTTIEAEVVQRLRWYQCCAKIHSAASVRTGGRVVAMLHRALSWMLGIGLCVSPLPPTPTSRAFICTSLRRVSLLEAASRCGTIILRVVVQWSIN